MAQKDRLVTIGINSIKLQELDSAGADVGTPIELGQTREDSFNLTQEDGTTVDIRVEETDDPIYSRTAKGTYSVTWNSPNCDPESLAKVTGGTWSEADGYSSPSKAVVKDYRVIVASEDGYDLTLNRVSIRADFSGNLGRNNPIELVVNGNVLAPQDGKGLYNLKKK
ncbi:MAG: hypothetical protein ACRCVU_20115 [Flavobacterium sp.]